MISKECKRLVEVEFPINEVSNHSMREKFVRYGHPSGLHLWRARQPLAACRAILLALLLPDPCDRHCPEEFKTKAGVILQDLKDPLEYGDMALRKAMLKFIGDFADWGNANEPDFIEMGRGLVEAAYPEKVPLIMDLFAGAGSMPLEALRLGCDAYAGDSNPIARLILKFLLEEIPRYGRELAEELRRMGSEIEKQAMRELAEFYAQDPDGEMPYAHLWARTIRCTSSNCGAEIPLVRSFWLCRDDRSKKALRYKVIKPREGPPFAEFKLFEPITDLGIPEASIIRTRAVCLCCGNIISSEQVREQLSQQRGGADVIFNEKGRRIGGARLLAVVTLRGRKYHYRLPTEKDYRAVYRTKKRLEQMLDDWEQSNKQELPPVPDVSLPPEGTPNFRVQQYGMSRWSDLFTARQKLALVFLTRCIQKIENPIIKDAMAIVMDRCIDYLSSICTWDVQRQLIVRTFSRQALPISWDFCEGSFFGKGPGGIENAIDWVTRVIEAWPGSKIGRVKQNDGTKHMLSDSTPRVWFTDPPAYGANPCDDFSNFFLPWLKRALPGHLLLSPPGNPENTFVMSSVTVSDNTKSDSPQPENYAGFEEAVAKLFSKGRHMLNREDICSVVFNKTAKGREALVTGLINEGWIITASWPISTGTASCSRGKDFTNLTTDVYLICRPRPENAPVGSWEEILRELPQRVNSWAAHLQRQGICGSDLAFACIGPALEIFSRYCRVENVKGETIRPGIYLEKVFGQISTVVKD